MRILVTGGAGFIGSNLVHRLVTEGHDVCVVDDLSTGRLANVRDLIGRERFRFIHESILNVPLMESLLQEAELVYHLAAVVGVKYVLDDPIRTVKVNVAGTENILELAYRLDRRALVVSSSEVYGKSVRIPLNEADDRLLGPTHVYRWAYAESKALDEYLALAYARQGLRVSVVRYFNSYGPHTHPDGYGSVITRFVLQALKGQPLTVFGDGTQTRCFTYVEDTVEGTVRAALSDVAKGEVFNIGSDQEITLLDLARCIRELANSQSEIVHVSYSEAFGDDFEEPQRRVPDMTKARRLLGFRAAVPLAEGLQKTIDWFRSNGFGY